MLWIEGIVESTPSLPFLINSKVDMAKFMDPRKVVARKNAFKALQSAQNEDDFFLNHERRRRRILKTKN